MIYSHIEIVTVLTVLLYGIPLTWAATKTGLFRNRTINELTRTLNKSLVLLITIAIALTMGLSYLDKKIYPDGHGNQFTDILMELGMVYLIIGTFIYLPIIIILNLTNLLIRRKQTTN